MKSVATTAELLRCFTVERPSLGLADLAKLMGRSKATVHRYASALERVGFLSYDSERKTYAVGPETLRLASVLLQTSSVIDVAGPVLKRLTRQTSQTTTLSMWIGERPVVVLCELSGAITRLDVPPGTHLPPHSAAGLVFRALLPGASGSDASVEAEAERVRATGVALTTDVVTGLRAAAAPVLGGGRIVAALTIVGTTPTMPEGLDHPAIDLLRAAAGELSYKLGSVQPPAPTDVS